AFVYDPIGKDEGAFIWRAGKPVREPFLVQDIDAKNVLTDAEKATEDSTMPLPTLHRRRRIGAGTWAIGALGLILGAAAIYFLFADSFVRPHRAPAAPAAAQTRGR